MLQSQKPYIVRCLYTPSYLRGREERSLSVRDQERRAREAIRRLDEVASRIERRMQGATRQVNEATLRAEEVRRRIEVGDFVPRPLPSLREDSLESTESPELRDKTTNSEDYGYGEGY